MAPLCNGRIALEESCPLCMVRGPATRIEVRASRSMTLSVHAANNSVPRNFIKVSNACLITED